MKKSTARREAKERDKNRLSLLTSSYFYKYKEFITKLIIKNDRFWLSFIKMEKRRESTRTINLVC